MLLTLFFSAVLATNTVREYNVLEIQDDSHLYSEYGVYLEPGGQYLSYSGSITIPFTYVLPSLNILGKTFCPGHNKIVKIQENVINHLKKMTGSFNRAKTRHRRSFIPIVSVLTGGLGVWNTIEIQNLKSTIIKVESNSLEINKRIQEITDSQNMLLDNIHEMSLLVGDQSRVLNDILNKTDCIQRDQNEFQMYVSNWLFSSPSEFLEAYSGAVTGRVTPQLVSAKNLADIIIKHKEMTNTIYQYEPEIVYELGKVLLLEVNIDNQAFIRGIIVMPKVLALSPMPMYNVYKVNIYHDGADIIYDIPDTLICPNISSCWEPNIERCTRMTNRLLCIHGTDAYVNECISAIHMKGGKCNKLIRKHSDPLVIQTHSGVLIGGSNKSYKIYKQVNGINILSGVTKINNNAQLLTYKDGDWISINDNIYSTLISGFNYNCSIYINNNITHSDYQQLPITHEWKHINQLTPIKMNNSIDPTIIVVTTLVITNIILIVIIYYQYKVTHDSKRIDKCEIPIMGLR